MTVLVGTNTAAGATDFFGSGDLAATRYQAVASGTADTMRVLIRSGSTFTSMTVGIYTDSGGTQQPVTKLTQGTITSNVAGIQSCSITPVSIVSGTVYFLAVSPVGGGFNFNGASCLLDYRGNTPQTPGNLPSTWPGTNFDTIGTAGGIPLVVEQTGAAAGLALVGQRLFPRALLIR